MAHTLTAGSTTADRPRPEKNYLNQTTGIWSWLTTVDHKRIGIMYLIGVSMAFLAGGVFALLVRLHLWEPNGALFKNADYNQIFTLHGAFMVFIFVIPAIAFVITKRICLSLQRRDREKLLVLRRRSESLRPVFDHRRAWIRRAINAMSETHDEFLPREHLEVLRIVVLEPEELRAAQLRRVEQVQRRLARHAFEQKRHAPDRRIVAFQPTENRSEGHDEVFAEIRRRFHHGEADPAEMRWVPLIIRARPHNSPRCGRPKGRLA